MAILKAGPDPLDDLAEFLEPFARLVRRPESLHAMERYTTCKRRRDNVPPRWIDRWVTAFENCTTYRLQLGSKELDGRWNGCTTWRCISVSGGPAS